MGWSSINGGVPEGQWWYMMINVEVLSEIRGLMMFDGLMVWGLALCSMIQQDLDSRWGISFRKPTLQERWSRHTEPRIIPWISMNSWSYKYHDEGYTSRWGELGQTGFPAVRTPFHGYLLFCPCVVLSWMPIWKVSGFKIGTFQYIISYYTIYVLQIQSPCHHVHAYTPCHVLDGYCCGKVCRVGGQVGQRNHRTRKTLLENLVEFKHILFKPYEYVYIIIHIS